MKYELRVWKKIDNMPKTFTPHEEKGRVGELLSKLGGSNEKNPDILIDADGANQSPITSAVITYDVSEKKIKRNDQVVKSKSVTIKMSIKGNLYLPLNASAADKALQAAAGSIVGDKAKENKLRDTLLMSKWAEVKPDAPEDDGYLRGVLLSVLTKAGDFRLISANNMYVESYRENYSEGEFGTFELKLAQQREAGRSFNVQGLSGETQSVISQIKGKLSQAATNVAIVAATAKVAGAVVKKGVQTYEKFNGGETEVTRWLKFSADTASAAGGLTDAMQKKDFKAAGDTVAERIKTGKDTDHALVPLDELEKLHLGWIKADPERYAKYLKMSENDKRKELQKAADEKLDRINLDINVNKEKINAYGDDLEELEALYLDQIKKDPERYKKYQKMSDEQKMVELLTMALNDFDKKKSTGNTKSASNNTNSSNANGTSLNGGGLSTMLGAAALQKTNGNSNDGGGNGSH